MVLLKNIKINLFFFLVNCCFKKNVSFEWSSFCMFVYSGGAFLSQNVFQIRAGGRSGFNKSYEHFDFALLHIIAHGLLPSHHLSPSLSLSVRADTCQRWPRRPASPQWSSTTPPCRPRCPPSRSPRPTRATPSRCPQLLPPTTETMTSRCYDARTYVITYSRHTHGLTDDYYYVFCRAPPMVDTAVYKSSSIEIRFLKMLNLFLAWFKKIFKNSTAVINARAFLNRSSVPKFKC